MTGQFQRESPFSYACDHYMDTVYRVAVHNAPSAEDAEDVTQEVFERLLTCRKGFADEEHLRRWLVRVTLNVCKDISRSPWHRRTVSLEACPEPVFSTPERGELYQAVMDLPVKYRMPLYLYYYEGYSVTEVGELLHLKVSTVQTRLARGRAKLKQEWED